MSYFIDTDQGLYVIDSGTGYSCLGFAVAERKRQAVLVWADGVADGPYALGTPEHYEAYTQAMAIGLAHHLQTKERCPPDQGALPSGADAAARRARGQARRSDRARRETTAVHCGKIDRVDALSHRAQAPR